MLAVHDTTDIGTADSGIMSKFFLSLAELFFVLSIGYLSSLRKDFIFINEGFLQDFIY